MVSTTSRNNGPGHFLHVLRTGKILRISDLRERPKSTHEQLRSAEERGARVRVPLITCSCSLHLNTAPLCVSCSTRYFTAQNGKELKWKIADGRMEVGAFPFHSPFGGLRSPGANDTSRPSVLQRAQHHRDLRKLQFRRQKGNREVDHQAARAPYLHRDRHCSLAEPDGIGLWMAGQLIDVSIFGLPTCLRPPVLQSGAL